MSTQNMARAFNMAYQLLVFALNLQFACGLNAYISKDCKESEEYIHDYNGSVLQGCMCVVSASVGTLKFPCHSSHLPHRFVECDWVIKGHSGQRVTFSFTTFDLPHADIEGHCRAAYVNFGRYDYKSRRVAEGRVCGRHPPITFHAVGFRAWVTVVVTGTARPEVYDRHAGVALSYQIKNTDILKTHLLLGFVVAIVIPVICCCPMVCYYQRHKNKEEKSYISFLRTETLRQKRAVREALEKRDLWTPKTPAVKHKGNATNKTIEMGDLSESKNNFGNIGVEQQSFYNDSTMVHKPEALSKPGGSQRREACAHSEARTATSCSVDIVSPMTTSLDLRVNCSGGCSGGCSGAADPRSAPMTSSTPCACVTAAETEATQQPAAERGHSEGYPASARDKGRARKMSVAFSLPSMGSISEMEEPRMLVDSDEAWDADMTSVSIDEDVSDVFTERSSSD